MLNLICGKISDFDLLHASDRTYRSRAAGSRVVEPQEPIHVDVRVRQSGQSYTDPQYTAHASGEPGRLPVGTLLDCYV